MKRCGSLLVLLIGQLPALAWAQETSTTTDALAKERSALNTIATKTGLTAMHANLKAVRELEFTTTFKIVDRVIGTRRSGTVKYQLKQPNLLRVTVTSGKQHLTVVSDGELLTIHRRNTRKYSQSPARDSIVGSLYTAAGVVGVQPRIIDFFWSVDYLATLGGFPRITSTGPLKVGGKTCDGVRLVYKEDEWNVWLERSERRFPCRLVSKRKDGSAFTIQTNTFTWSEKRQIADSEFQFSPPRGHKREK
ncbi:MAG: DUF2092 domain-containing protein [Hyphomicrobiaceae bacterium]